MKSRALQLIKKALGASVSVILLTAKDEVEDRIRGLETGADDYLGKPFSFAELLARIQARVRQTQPERTDVLAAGDFLLNDGAHEVRYRGEVLVLTPTEYNLLHHLLVVFLIGLLQAVSLRRAMLGQLQDLLASRLHNVPVGLLASSDTTQDIALRASDLMKALVDRDVSLLILDANGEEMTHSETEVRDWYNSRLIPFERSAEPLAVPRLDSGAYRLMLQSDGFPESRLYRMPDGTRMVLGFAKLGNLQAPAGLIQMAVSAGEADAFVLRQLGVFGVLALAALLLGGFLASSVLRRTLNPLRRLNDAVEAQNADSLERRIPEDAGQEEIDRLSHTYNLMLSRIQEAYSHERLQQERMRRFLSDVAHELKTPLTSIQGFAEVLLMGAAEDEAQLSDSLEVIRSERAPGKVPRSS